MITKEKLGGYLAISVRVNKLTTNQREQLDSVFSVGTDGSSGEVELEISEAAQNQLQNVDFYMSAIGPLGPGQVDKVSNLKPEDIVDYINSYQTKYTNALQQNKFDSKYYGIVKDQTYNHYNTEVYAECNVTTAQKALTCHNNFQKTSKTFLEDREELRRRLKEATWKLNHKSRVNWRNGRQTISKYEQTKENIQSCFDDVKDARSNCRDAFNSVDLKRLCGADGSGSGGGSQSSPCDTCDGACTMPECAVDWRSSSDFTLPTAEVRPPNSNVTVNFHPIGSNTVNGLDSHHSHICVLSKVQGGFFGGGEAVGLDKGRDNWRIYTTTNHHTEHEKITAAAACVSKSKFTNGNGSFVVGSADAGTDTGYQGPDWSTNMGAAKIHRDSYGTNSTRIGTNPNHATTLIGLRGHLHHPNHGGSMKRIKSSSANRIVAQTDDSGACQSNKCYMRARGLAWGLDTSKRDSQIDGPKTAQTTPSDGYDKTKLIAADRGFCYLKSLRGMFDGPSEKAYLTIENDYWYLHANAACLPGFGWQPWNPDCDHKIVQATAECYYYDHTKQP